MMAFTIQMSLNFSGYQDINKTLISACVYYVTARNPFASAMARIEGIAVADWSI